MESREYARPTLLVSACLGFNECNYHGRGHKCQLIESLSEYADIKTVCPEGGMGLATPRPVLRIVREKDEDRLIQPKTGEDFTDRIEDFSVKFLEKIKVLDGCILKNRSPTCGIRDVKIYKKGEDEVPFKKGSGFFAASLARLFPQTLIEDEGRLTSLRLRNNFLTVVFTKADFRRVLESREKEELDAFHQRNTLLFLAYSKTRLREMDKLLKQPDLTFDDASSHYEVLLNDCLGKIPRVSSHQAALEYAFSALSPKLKESETEFFMSRLSLYKEEKLPLSAMTTLLRSFFLRFSNDEMERQTYFSPFPEDLSLLGDSKR